MTGSQTTEVRASAVETQVLAVVEQLADEDSVLHKNFYGEDGVVPTDLRRAPHHLNGHTLLVKDETRHAGVNAFKRRGALAATLLAVEENLSDPDSPKLTRVVTASAGNHGLGLVAAARQLGLEATVYGRHDMSPIKIARIRALGGNVIATSATLGDAMVAADTAGKLPGVKNIHPFDAVPVIAGQATVGLEMLDSLLMRQAAGTLDLRRDPVTVVLPEGGGGLAAGVGVVFKHARDHKLLGDSVRVLTAQPEDKANHPWCDGTATQTGRLTEAVLRDTRYIQERLVVSDEDLAHAMHEASQYAHKAVEPAGALALAGARVVARNRSVRQSRDTETFVVPLTGANVTPERYADAMRLHDKRHVTALSQLGNLAARPAYSPDASSHQRKSRLNVLGGFIGS